jgi:hypothetical protein
MIGIYTGKNIRYSRCYVSHGQNPPSLIKGESESCHGH